MNADNYTCTVSVDCSAFIDWTYPLTDPTLSKL